MSYIIEEMRDHMPEGFLGHNVLLAANLAISSLYNSTAIQAILFGSLWYMGQTKIFLKNSHKNTSTLSFSFPQQIR